MPNSLPGSIIDFLGDGTDSVEFRTPGNLKMPGFEISDKGSVTQLTSSTTAVTLNSKVGTITTVSQTLAAGGGVTFQFNNSYIGLSGNTVMLSCYYDGTGGVPLAVSSNETLGSMDIVIHNVDDVSTMDAPVRVHFWII